MDVVKIKGRTLTFLGEWLSSSVMLLLEPSKFIPAADKKPLQGAGRTSSTRKHVGFAASSVFVALIVFQLVVAQSDNGHAWTSIKESLPFSLLVTGTWVIWSIILAIFLKGLGGSQTPFTNVVFGIRALATFYVFCMILGTLFFIAFGKRWAIFQWTEIIVSFSLYTIYCPIVFSSSNGIRGFRFYILCTVAVCLSAVKTLVEFYAMTNNPFFPPVAAPPPEAFFNHPNEAVFNAPKHRGLPIDYCYHWGGDCGSRAANAFCNTVNYEKAKDFVELSNVATTYIIGDGLTCPIAPRQKCATFVYITCTNE
jgi:hypothetical protein